jgi:hypothetical protein
MRLGADVIQKPIGFFCLFLAACYAVAIAVLVAYLIARQLW